MKNTFKITVGETPALCSIELNGQKLHGVTSVSFDLDGQRKPSALRLEIIGEILVDGEFHDRVIASTEPHDPDRQPRDVELGGVSISGRTGGRNRPGLMFTKFFSPPRKTGLWRPEPENNRLLSKPA